ncbi:hypothetical protein FGO68_gene16888 [Halteria grandinella]|uniref:Uncharacterized protein n=1 Tax=Halteria grandinella TaxID=5974 RepID=A0A8J8NZW4_HALGN|nr:hypothetical protein FGO68_gene16888 [Halteria grandinella]
MGLNNLRIGRLTATFLIQWTLLYLILGYDEFFQTSAHFGFLKLQLFTGQTGDFLFLDYFGTFFFAITFNFF